MSHLVHVFSTFAPGGPQMRVTEILRSLPPTFRHTILATNGELGAREKLPPGLPVAFADAPRRPGGGVRRGALRRQLLDLRADLLLTYNWGATDAILVSALGGFPPILHAEDGFGPDESAGQLPRRIWARRGLLRLVEAVVVPSRNLERIAHEIWWMPRRRVLYVRNGIDTARFSPGDGAPFRERLRIPRESFVVGTVAHLRVEKNPLRLLRAFAASAIADSHLVFVGEGPERAALDRFIAERGLAGRVHFPGFLSDPVGAYRSFDVFALSSDTEQMPLSVLEAMGAGRAIVSTDVGDVRSMVAPANAAFLAPLGDDAAYAAALRALSGDAPLRARIGDANRARCVADFSLEQQSCAYRDLYERFLAGRDAAWRSEHFRR